MRTFLSRALLAFLALAGAAVVAVDIPHLAHALGPRSYSHGQPPTYPGVTPYVQMGLGQSWAENAFDCMGCNGFNPQSDFLSTLAVSNPNYPSGVEPTGAGINLIPIAGLASFTPSMLGFGQYPGNAATRDSGSSLSIDRAAALAHIALKQRYGKTVNGTITFTAACPSSDWVSGPCNGLGPGSDTWTRLGTINTALQSKTPATRPVFLNAAQWKETIYTQGGALDQTEASTLTQFASMESDIDTLNLPGVGTTGMQYYISQRGGLSTWTVMSGATQGIIEFVRANANGRTNGGNPWYQYTLPGNNIHFGDYGTIRLGEAIGLAEYTQEELSIAPTPLWANIATPITVSGSKVIFHFDRPSWYGFDASVLEWITDPNEGISAAPQYGFDVKINGVETPCTPAIAGLTVECNTGSAIARGASVTGAYAWYGPGGFTAEQSGVWGNLAMRGPASVFTPWTTAQSTVGGTINAWAWSIPPTTVTAP